MSVPTATPRVRASKPGRVAVLTAHDGRIARTLLRVFGHFVASASFYACLAPSILFQLLVGWQGTHLALWVGAACALPVAPGVIALIATTRNVLITGATAGAGRTFWDVFARAARVHWWLAAVAGVGILLIGYDITLLGGTANVLLLGFAFLAVLMTFLIAASEHILGNCNSTGREVTSTAVRAILRQPHLALSWAALIVLAVLASAIPLIGGTVALFAPALVSTGIVICNIALHYGGAPKGTTT